MKATFELKAEKRDDLGKGASRRLRRTGKVPAIVYGLDVAPQSLSLASNEIMKCLDIEAFYSQIVDINVDGAITQVVVRDIQRHPYKSTVAHMDFQRIDLNKEIHVHVPLHFMNQDTCPGTKAGDNISHEQIEVEISCLPKDLPEFIEVDLGDMDTGDSVHLSDLKVPAGVTIVELGRGEDHDLPIASCHAKRVAVDEDAEEGEAAAAEEGGEA